MLEAVYVLSGSEVSVHLTDALHLEENNHAYIEMNDSDAGHSNRNDTWFICEEIHLIIKNFPRSFLLDGQRQPMRNVFVPFISAPRFYLYLLKARVEWVGYT